MSLSQFEQPKCPQCNHASQYAAPQVRAQCPGGHCCSQDCKQQGNAKKMNTPQLEQAPVPKMLIACSTAAPDVIVSARYMTTNPASLLKAGRKSLLNFRKAILLTSGNQRQKGGMTNLYHRKPPERITRCRDQTGLGVVGRRQCSPFSSCVIPVIDTIFRR